MSDHRAPPESGSEDERVQRAHAAMTAGIGGIDRIQGGLDRIMWIVWAVLVVFIGGLAAFFLLR